MNEPSNEDIEFRRHCDAVLQAALELGGAERQAFLAKACGEDAALRSLVDALLEAHAGDDGALTPGGALSPELLGDVEEEPRTSTRIGRYRLLEELGRGGMGVVYRAEREDGAYEQTVAVKLLKPGASSAVVERFTRERHILATLDHPNVARLLDGGVTEAGEPFLVVEHVEGLPIDRYCQSNDLPLEARLRLLIELCAGVHEAHRRLIVHRDIKPANILITPTGQPRVHS